MGKSDIEIAVLRHRKARIRELRHMQLLHDATISPPEEINYMERRIYMVATEGTIEAFNELVAQGRAVLTEITPQGNTILHLSAIYGHFRLLEHIINHEREVFENWDPIPNYYQSLLLRPNSNGDLPLHVAAAAGHAPAVIPMNHLFSHYLNQLPRGMQIFLREGRQVEVGDVWVVQNNGGNTALHLALKANHQDVALRLAEVDPRVSFVPNEERASPLYMAAEAGDVLLVARMLISPVPRYEGKSVMHAAIKSKNIEILNLLLVPIRQNLINSRDEEKRSVLSYAASIGYDEGVERLLQEFSNIAYVKDPDGFFPIHSACRRGHMGALQAILQSCPDTIELLNLQGQNVLHVAAECGKNEVVKYILKNEKYANLINQKDHKGNTPLHLATMFWYPMIVHILTKDERVNVGEQNKLGFTALDAAEECMDLNPTFRELGDLVLILNVFKFVLPLLGIALISMSFAFLAGGVFLGMLFLLVVPFVCPYTSRPSFFRYVLRYPFYLLLMLIVWDDTDDDLE
ncbi:unnamed protein product [Brassica napus]|uniref:(rape) hypothetical protein n=1 Tax=Brassica napus TaxID=3708 RepID=A0A817B0L9_BRANA|nr:unnamed protein product [Brassica napus]